MCLFFSLAQWASLGLAGLILWLWSIRCVYLSRKFHGLSDQMCRLLTWFHLTSHLSTSQILPNIIISSSQSIIRLINSIIFIYTNLPSLYAFSSFNIHSRNLSLLTIFFLQTLFSRCVKYLYMGMK